MMVSQLSEAWIENAKVKNTAFVQKTIAQLQATHQLRDLPSITPRVEIGLAVSRVLDIVKEEKFELIVVGTQGEHSSWDRVLGSVSTGLVKNAKVPILVVPEDANYNSLANVTIAIDLKESDAWEIHKVCKLLHPEIKSLDILHVYSEGKDRETEISMQELEEYFNSNPQEFKINFLAKQSNSLNKSLLEHVAQRDSDLLVMLGPHLKGIRNWLFQSNTKNMTYESKVPFLRMN